MKHCHNSCQPSISKESWMVAGRIWQQIWRSLWQEVVLRVISFNGSWCNASSGKEGNICSNGLGWFDSVLCEREPTRWKWNRCWNFGPQLNRVYQDYEENSHTCSELAVKGWNVQGNHITLWTNTLKNILIVQWECEQKLSFYSNPQSLLTHTWLLPCRLWSQ